MTRPEIKVLYQCTCGWKRYITDTREWKEKVIIHPIYGSGTQFGLANLEVMEHNCMDFVRARKRAKARNEQPTETARDRAVRIATATINLEA